MQRIARTLVLLTGTLALALVGAGAAGAAAPKLVGPKAGAVLAVGSEPTFKARDGSAAARRYPLYITISTTKKRTKRGDLKRTKVGTFSSMKRRGSVHRYTAPDYSFPTWYMMRPGTYYWQVFRIDCSKPGCHVQSRVRSFRVQ
jgi:hypothetical protein